MNTDEPVKHYWLYTLRQERGKYYVGITAYKNPDTRVQQHMNGFLGAQWTKKYRVIEAIEKIDLGNVSKSDAERTEQEYTLRYMKKYGYQNVRGGRLNYSGKYIKFFGKLLPRDDFLQLVSVLAMLGCTIGLYWIARHH